MTKHWKSKISGWPTRKKLIFIFRLKASMEEVQKRFLAEQKTLKELNEKARQIEEALA